MGIVRDLYMARKMSAGVNIPAPSVAQYIKRRRLAGAGSAEYEGDIVEFDTPSAKKLKELTIYLEPIQEGTGDPSPDNVRPITGRTGAGAYLGAEHDPDTATLYSVDWTDDAGTVYSGTVDIVTGVLTVDEAKKVFDGTETGWSKSSTYKGSFYIHWYPYISNAKPNTEFLCSHAEYTSLGSGYVYGKCSSDSACNLFLMQDPNATIDDFKTFLADQYSNGTPVEICYPLDTPLIYQLTPQQVMSLVGSNTVWSPDGPVKVRV